jgi:Ca2+-binding EF-hand superfamily protein
MVGGLARTRLAKLDKDSSGAIDGDELTRNTAMKTRDHDGDGAVTLHELVYGEQRRETSSPEGMREADAPASDPRIVALAAAWQELLAPHDPASFDLDGNGVLETATELRALLERALDVDGDGKLDECESVAVPGSTAPPRRGPRKRGEAASALDRNRDGRLSSKELDPALAGALVLDQDADKQIDLQELGAVPRGDLGPRPLLVDALTLLRKLDKNGDGGLERREWPALLQPYLESATDEDRNGRLDERELLPVIARARDAGLRGVPRSGAARYDLDGDGRIDAAEFPGPSWVFRRLDGDRDGFLGPPKSRR